MTEYSAEPRQWPDCSTVRSRHLPEDSATESLVRHREASALVVGQPEAPPLQLVIDLRSRRFHVVGATPNPDAAFMAQAALWTA